MQHIQQYPHIRLFLYGWNKDASNDSSRIPISVPPTLIFEHGVPKAVLLPEDEVAEFLGGTTTGTNSFEAEFAQAQARYLEDRDAQLHAILEQQHNQRQQQQGGSQNHQEYDPHSSSGATGGAGNSSSSSTLMIPEPHIVTSRRSPKDVSHPMILAAMCNPVKAPDTVDAEAVVAYFVGIVEGERGEPRVDIRYMNREQLKRFFAKRELPDREGIGASDEGGQERQKAQKQSAILADYRMRTKDDDQSSELQHEMMKQQLLKEERESHVKRSSIFSVGSSSSNNNNNNSHHQKKDPLSPPLSPSVSGLGELGRSPPSREDSLLPPSLNLDSHSQQQQVTTPSSRKQTINKRNSTTSSSNQQQQQNNNTLTGFLQRFEYTPSHHSEIVTMKWTRSYCDFERIRNSLLLEDRSRRAAERAATVDAPPTLVRRYSVTERLKTLMRYQADLLTERFNSALHQAGRNFILKQATFLFKMGFHGHVYFLWCSKMQLEKYYPSGHPGQDWIALVRRPPHTAPTNQNNNSNNYYNNQQDYFSSSPNNTNQDQNQKSEEDQQQQQQQSPQQVYGNASPSQPRFHAFGRRFLEIGQDMLDRESMLRSKGLSKELGDLDENPLQARYDQGDDDDEYYSSSSGDHSNRHQSKRSTTATSNGSLNSNNNNNSSNNREGPSAGVGLMPLYSEHRIAVTQAQRHLGRALPLPLTLLTNVFRREEPRNNHPHNSNNNRNNNGPLTPVLSPANNNNNSAPRRSPPSSNTYYDQQLDHQGSKTMEILNAARSLRGNRDKMLEILKEADFSLHGRFERPKLRHAGQKHEEFIPTRSGSRGRSPSSANNTNNGSVASSPSFIKDDSKASNMTAKLIRLLGPKGRQAAKMMPELVAELEREELEKQYQLALKKQNSSSGSFSKKKEVVDGSSLEGNQQQPQQQTRREKGRGQIEFAVSNNDDLLLSDDHVITIDETDGGDHHQGTHNSNKKIPATNPHFGGPALARSVVSSWKSWVAAFLARVRKYEETEKKAAAASASAPSSPLLLVNNDNASETTSTKSPNRRGTLSRQPSSSPLYKVGGWDSSIKVRKDSNNNDSRRFSQSASPLQEDVFGSSSVGSASMMDPNSNNKPFVNPLAASVPLELLELHLRQLKLAHRETENITKANGSAVEYWREKFEQCYCSSDEHSTTKDASAAGVVVKTIDPEDARRIDKAANQHFHVDDTALHNCDVIDDEDIFCFVVPSVEAAEEICRMIHRTCVFSE